MKYIKRILASPFILGLHLVASNYAAIKGTILFVRYGGEWMSYDRKDKVSMKMIYKELKAHSKEQSYCTSCGDKTRAGDWCTNKECDNYIE